jgi:hypothetical protein
MLTGRPRSFIKLVLVQTQLVLSVYIMGIADKKYLLETYAKTIGKAIITGYCIKFKSLKDINTDILKTAILDGFEQTK